jgi:signal peptidase II
LNGRGPLLALAAAVAILDQATKALVDRTLELYESRSVIDGLLALTYVHNRGGAFGVLSGANLPFQSVLFALLGAAALCAIAVWGWQLPAAQRAARLASALVIGGAIGNLLDRVRLGAVRDFVDVSWGSAHWPAFNLADSAITVGVALLVLDVVRTGPAAEPAEASAGRE